jgi:hypothetical protein
MVVRREVTAAVALLALSLVLPPVLTGCREGSSSSPSGGPSGPVATAPHTTPSSGTPTSTPSPTDDAVGSPERPVAAAVGTTLLDWKSVPGSTENVVTVGDGWTLTVPNGGGSARLQGPKPFTIRAAEHSSITDAFLDDTHALVVDEDRLAADPDRAVLVDLASGRKTTLNGRSDPPTVVGGTWALGPDSLVHATSGPQRRYCLATVDLSGGSGTTGWCAEPRSGFSRASVTDDGTTLMTFDDHHPSCRTLNTVEGSELTPLPGVTRCKGWDSALLGGTAVWSVVPKERRIEAAHFYAHTDRGWWDLGPGTSGSLVVCAGSAFFIRDPASRADPARLLRWSPDDAGLTVAYASKGTGNAFLAPPRCGGTHLTITAYSQAGDEQVTTNLG